MNNMNKPFYTMVTLSLFISSIMAASSTNWLFLWMAMEINMLSFIPLMTHSKSNQETEAAIKYFMAQALGSSIMLMTSMSQWIITSSYSVNLILMCAILLKLGMAPFHFWFPPVMTSMPWMSCMILATWQKLAPLLILAFILDKISPTWMISIAMINALIGGMMGMNQSHLRTIMAYSSITHMGWMTSMLYISKSMLTLTYYIMYCLITAPLFLMMNFSNQITNSQSNKLNLMSPIMQLMIPMMLLSLGGVPPFTGFIPKWITIQAICAYDPIVLLVMIFGAMMSTYFYMNIAFNSILSMNQTLNIMSINNINMKLLTIIASLMLFALPLLLI